LAKAEAELQVQNLNKLAASLDLSETEKELLETLQSNLGQEVSQ